MVRGHLVRMTGQMVALRLLTVDFVLTEDPLKQGRSALRTPGHLGWTQWVLTEVKRTHVLGPQPGRRARSLVDILRRR